MIFKIKMECKPVYQFLVWDNCKNNCQFCFQRKNPRILNRQKKIQCLNDIFRFLNSPEYISGSHVLICGGEIFDTYDDIGILTDFFRKFILYMVSGKVDLLYINTNLIYENTEALDNFLKICRQHKIFDRLRFTTSYDVYGRFKSEHDRDMMLNNLKQVRRNYPECNIIVNMILTKYLCQAILNSQFDIFEFMKVYQCQINLIPYIILKKQLAADRNTIFKTFRFLRSKNEQLIQYIIKNTGINQQKKLYVYENDEFKYCSCKLSSCGHSQNFKKYSQNGTCYCCDMQEIFQ